MRAQVPDGLIAEVADASVAVSETVATGDAWLAEGRSAALRVPSVLLPYAWNVLLNPRHADVTRAGIGGIKGVHF